jgi:hypothetical protein
MTTSTSHAVNTATLFAKFAQMTPPERVLALQALTCLACDKYRECAVGRCFLEELRTVPDCPLN